MSINIKAFDKDENRVCIKDSEFLGQIDTLKDGEPNEYWTIGQNPEHYEENPLPEPRATIKLDYELPGMEGTWNKDTEENPQGLKPVGRNVGYGLVVYGDAIVFEHDTLHYSEEKRTYTPAFVINDDFIEGTMVIIGSHEYTLAEIMDGPGTPGDQSWAKALYVTLANDRTNPTTIKFTYADGVEETFGVVCLIGEDDPSITELGGTNVVHHDPSEPPTEEQLEDVRKTLFGTNKAWVPKHLLHDLVDVHE